ncbi:hemicentin-2 isoform X3, partial [Vespula maculifrons]
MANPTFASSINERSQKFHYVCGLSNTPRIVGIIARCLAEIVAGEQLFLKPDRLATLKHPSKIEKPPQYTTFKP